MSEIEGIVANIKADVSDPDLRKILLELCSVVESQQGEIRRLRADYALPWDGQPENFCSSEQVLGLDRVIGEPTQGGDASEPPDEDHNGEAVDAGRIDSGHHDPSGAPYSC